MGCLAATAMWLELGLGSADVEVLVFLKYKHHDARFVECKMCGQY